MSFTYNGPTLVYPSNMRTMTAAEKTRHILNNMSNTLFQPAVGIGHGLASVISQKDTEEDHSDDIDYRLHSASWLR